MISSMQTSSSPLRRDPPKRSECAHSPKHSHPPSLPKTVPKKLKMTSNAPSLMSDATYLNQRTKMRKMTLPMHQALDPATRLARGPPKGQPLPRKCPHMKSNEPPSQLRSAASKLRMYQSATGLYPARHVQPTGLSTPSLKKTSNLSVSASQCLSLPRKSPKRSKA